VLFQLDLLLAAHVDEVLFHLHLGRFLLAGLCLLPLARFLLRHVASQNREDDEPASRQLPPNR
jgi:hypothetical protein